MFIINFYVKCVIENKSLPRSIKQQKQLQILTEYLETVILPPGLESLILILSTQEIEKILDFLCSATPQALQALIATILSYRNEPNFTNEDLRQILNNGVQNLTNQELNNGLQNLANQDESENEEAEALTPQLLTELNMALAEPTDDIEESEICTMEEWQLFLEKNELKDSNWWLMAYKENKQRDFFQKITQETEQLAMKTKQKMDVINDLYNLSNHLSWLSRDSVAYRKTIKEKIEALTELVGKIDQKQYILWQKQLIMLTNSELIQNILTLLEKPIQRNNEIEGDSFLNLIERDSFLNLIYKTKWELEIILSNLESSFTEWQEGLNSKYITLKEFQTIENKFREQFNQLQKQYDIFSRQNQKKYEIQQQQYKALEELQKKQNIEKDNHTKKRQEILKLPLLEQNKALTAHREEWLELTKQHKNELKQHNNQFSQMERLYEYQQKQAAENQEIQICNEKDTWTIKPLRKLSKIQDGIKKQSIKNLQTLEDKEKYTAMQNLFAD